MLFVGWWCAGLVPGASFYFFTDGYFAAEERSLVVSSPLHEKGVLWWALHVPSIESIRSVSQVNIQRAFNLRVSFRGAMAKFTTLQSRAPTILRARGISRRATSRQGLSSAILILILGILLTSLGSFTQYMFPSQEFYISAIGLVSTVPWRTGCFAVKMILLNQTNSRTKLLVAAKAFSLLGMVVYNRWMQHWRYPFILMESWQTVLSLARVCLRASTYAFWGLRPPQTSVNYKRGWPLKETVVWSDKETGCMYVDVHSLFHWDGKHSGLRLQPGQLHGLHTNQCEVGSVT